MKITIIILTTLYLILVIIANYIFKLIGKHDSEFSIEKFSKAYTIGNVCRVVSFAVLIIDIAFILAFLF